MKFRIEVEIDMREVDEGDAVMWMASVLECAFKKKNPVPPPKDPIERAGWTPEVPLPPSEHPYLPEVVGARRV